MRKLHPVLQLEKVGKPTGACTFDSSILCEALMIRSGQKCGSIFINRAFLKWLRSILGENNYCQLDPNLDIEKDAFHASETPSMRYLMQKFDERKEAFDRDTGDFGIDLPDPLGDLTIPGIVDQGLIMISRWAKRLLQSI